MRQGIVFNELKNENREFSTGFRLSRCQRRSAPRSGNSIVSVMAIYRQQPRTENSIALETLDTPPEVDDHHAIVSLTRSIWSTSPRTKCVSAMTDTVTLEACLARESPQGPHTRTSEARANHRTLNDDKGIRRGIAFSGTNVKTNSGQKAV